MNRLQRNPHTIAKLVLLLSSKQKFLFSLLLCGLLVGTFLEVLAVSLMLPFMSLVMGSGDVQLKLTSFILNQFADFSSIEKIKLISLFMAFLYMFKGVYQIILQLVQAKLLTRTRANLAVQLFEISINKPYIYHTQHNTSELQRTLALNVPSAIAMIGSLMTMISETTISAGLLLLLFFASPGLTLFAIVLLVIFLAISNFAVRKPIRLQGELYQKHGTQMLATIQQALGGIKFIYATRRQKAFTEEYRKNAVIYALSGEKYTFLSSIPRLIIENFSLASIFICMFYAITSDTSLIDKLPVIATFALATVRLMPVTNRIFGAMTQISYQAPAVEAVYSLFIDLKHTVARNEDSNITDMVNAIEHKSSLLNGVELRGLSFRFPGAPTNLFSNLSMSIPANKSVALVGATGAGKTTLADIILGLQEPLHGQVIADGRNIFDNKTWWANRVGYIPQQIFLLDDSIRANIIFGSPHVGDKRIWECLALAQLEDFVKGLPEGLDTVTGENGIRLSGGQCQRVSIARALYANPAFLVMDEATSALDDDTEQAIVETINNLAGQKTILIIAHRKTTITHCDIVYRLEDGRITQER